MARWSTLYHVNRLRWLRNHRKSEIFSLSHHFDSKRFTPFDQMRSGINKTAGDQVTLFHFKAQNFSLLWAAYCFRFICVTLGSEYHWRVSVCSLFHWLIGKRFCISCHCSIAAVWVEWWELKRWDARNQTKTDAKRIVCIDLYAFSWNRLLFRVEHKTGCVASMCIFFCLF